MFTSCCIPEMFKLYLTCKENWYDHAWELFFFGKSWVHFWLAEKSLRWMFLKHFKGPGDQKTFHQRKFDFWKKKTMKKKKGRERSIWNTQQLFLRKRFLKLYSTHPQSKKKKKQTNWLYYIETELESCFQTDKV